MDKLKKQVTVAQRRLILQQYLAAVPWCLFGTLLIAAVAIAIPKLLVLGVDGQVWAIGWLAGSVVAGLIAAAGWTYFSRRSPLDAALEIDRRFRLKERVSSMMSLEQEQLETAAGQALVKDAVRRVERIDVRNEFAVSMGPRAWLPLVPAALAFCLVMFVQDKGLDNPASATPSNPAETKQVKKSTEVLRRKLAQRRKKAQEKGLKDAEGLFKKLEEGTRKLGDKKDVDRRKAMVELKDLARDLQQRRKALGAADKIKEQLNKLKNLKQGPADKMAKAMRDGDFQKALDELKKLQNELKDGKLDDPAKQEMAEQLKQMGDKLQQAADAHAQAMNDVKQQLKQAQAAGDKDKANALEQQLNKLAQQAPQMDQLAKMAKQLGKASQNMKSGSPQDASQALDQIAQDLKNMQQQLDEMDMLDDALDQIAQAKDSMGCKQCAGAGCKQCNGQGQGLGQGQGKGKGNGLGEGQGEGARPEEKHDTKAYDSRVRQNVGRGKAVVTDLVDGPNIKGRTLEEIKAEMQASDRQASDPLTGRRLPRRQREHAKQYFDSFREGE